MKVIQSKMNSSNEYELAYRDVALLGMSFVTARDDIKVLHPTLDIETDARISAFARCANVCVSTTLSLGLFLQNVAKDEWWQNEVTPVYNKEEIKQMRHEYQQFLRLGFVHFSYVAIESALRALNKSVDPDFNDNNFKNIYDNLLTELGLKRHRCLLDLLRLLRNTIHTNGYHNDDDNAITYKGTKYVFIRGERAEYFAWSFLASLIYDVKDMLLEMVKSEKLASKAFVKDPFVMPKP